MRIMCNWMKRFVWLNVSLAEVGSIVLRKYAIKLVPFILTVLLLLTGCATKAPQTSGAAEGKLTVYASFYPMADFARQVGGDLVDVVTMVPDGTEPHDWEPTAADVAGLGKASVFVYNGAGMEHWAEDVLASLQSKSLIVVEASRGITLLEGDAKVRDSHVWLNPANAKAEMENIKQAFAQADPEHKDVYEANFTKAAAELEKLDQEFKAALSPLKNKEIIVAHQAFGYLCDAYGLTQVAIEGVAADAEPDPARVAEIIELAREHKVKVIFFEELVSPKVAEAIASAIGAKTDVLSPLEGLSEEQRAAGGNYYSVMRQNLKALVAALQ